MPDDNLSRLSKSETYRPESISDNLSFGTWSIDSAFKFGTGSNFPGLGLASTTFQFGVETELCKKNGSKHPMTCGLYPTRRKTPSFMEVI